MGWSTIHASLAVQWVARRLWLVGGPVSGLGSHWGIEVGIKTPSTIWAPCHAPLGKPRPTGQHRLCLPWLPYPGTSLPSGKGGDLVRKEGREERLLEWQFALQAVPAYGPLVALGLGVVQFHV